MTVIQEVLQVLVGPARQIAGDVGYVKLLRRLAFDAVKDFSCGHDRTPAFLAASSTKFAAMTCAYVRPSASPGFTSASFAVSALDNSLLFGGPPGLGDG